MDTTTSLVSIKLLDEVGDHVGQADIFERDGKFVLYWTDFVINEWEESFKTFNLALARLSVLHFAVGAGLFFSNDPHNFAEHANDFLKSQIVEMN